MNKYEDLYKRLQQERQQILNKLDLSDIQRQEHPENREGSPYGKREEEASETVELEKKLVLEKKMRESLAEIDHAIEKYNDGTYGKCDICGQLIEEQRLKIRPQASLCVKCKSNPVKYAKEAK